MSGDVATELDRRIADNLKAIAGSSKGSNDFKIIKIIPEEIPHIKLKHTPLMDYDQIIYNCGGIMGLWFGISAYGLVINIIKFHENYHI